MAIVFPAKHAGEGRILQFDFSSLIGVNETISSAVVGVSLYSGTDPAPGAIVSGAASVSGNIVSQLITGGTMGNIYELVCQATTTLNQILQVVGLLSITEPLPLSGAGGSQLALQFQDEGVNLGSAGTADTLNFTGAGVTATRLGSIVTVNVPQSSAGTVVELTASTSSYTLSDADNNRTFWVNNASPFQLNWTSTTNPGRPFRCYFTMLNSGDFKCNFLAGMTAFQFFEQSSSGPFLITKTITRAPYQLLVAVYTFPGGINYAIQTLPFSGNSDRPVVASSVGGNELRFDPLVWATANAGANGAPPATVAGYISFFVGATQCKVPYYNN